MDTFTAVPSIMRLPITVIDREKYAEWLESEDLTVDSNPPTVTKIFIAYAKGPGTPVPVQIEVDKLTSEYVRQAPTEQDRIEMDALDYYDKANRSAMLFRRNLLLAVVRGLDPDDANVLAHDENAGRLILERLGYLRSQAELEAEANESEGEASDDTGEAKAVNETGE